MNTILSTNNAKAYFIVDPALKSTKILFVSLLFIGVIKTSYSMELTLHNADQCCSNLNATDCVQCTTNVTYCCSNQPYTYHSYNTPFCCAIGEGFLFL
jgi:hypothetical protein